MKGDFTRFLFQPEKHYRDVRMQQGRVQLDADWNAQADILAYLRQRIVGDVVGPTGVPKGQDSFRIDVREVGANQLIGISPGHFYLEGLLCELHATPVAARVTGAQTVVPETLTVDGRKFQAGAWVRLFDGANALEVQIEAVDTDSLTLDSGGDLQALFGEDVEVSRLATYAQQPHTPNPDLDADLLSLDENMTYVVYLKAWKRHITAVEDSNLREVALGGADTTTRTKLVWLVGFEPTSATTCNDLGPSWRPSGEVSSGRIRARAQPDAEGDDLCLIPEDGGYRRLENQLYRVEVHIPGTPGSDAPTFKWSRNNGHLVTRLLEIDGAVLRVADTGKDAMSGLAPGQWVEVTDEARVMGRQPGVLARVQDVEGDEVRLENDLGVAFTPDALLTTLRPWEGMGEIETGAFLDLEGGVQVEFDDGYYATGDYWVIPARTVTGNIEWPQDADSRAPLFMACLGVTCAYAPLALVSHDGSKFRALDCRNRFPSLTSIAAEDVAFDDAVCQLGNASTVQEALDRLCQRKEGICTYTLVPGPGWEAVLDTIPDGVDAQLCFQAGTYPIGKPVVMRNKGHLKVGGAGTGTRLVAQGSEAALVFENCASVVVRDLYAETGRVGSKRENARFLNGTLTFRNSPAVEIEAVALKCGQGPERGAACIAVDQATPTGQVEAGTVRIRHCDLRVGHQQVGILLLNVTRSHVEDNVLRTSRQKWPLARLLQNKRYRGGVRRLLISKGQVEVDDEALVGGVPDGMALVTLDGMQVLFETDPALENTWQTFLEVTHPQGVKSARDLYLHLRNMADRLLTNGGDVSVRGVTFTGFRSWYNRLRSANLAVASQGIVVGGTVGREVRVLNNTVLGVLQGIHLGLGDRKTGMTAERLGTVRVAGNTIGVILSPYLRSRHGLFVGNCDTFQAQDNDIRVRRLTVTQNVPVDGIRVFGELGRKMVVRENYIDNFTVGAHVDVRNDLRGSPQWIIAENVFTRVPSGGSGVVASSSVEQRGNFD